MHQPFPPQTIHYGHGKTNFEQIPRRRRTPRPFANLLFNFLPLVARRRARIQQLGNISKGAETLAAKPHLLYNAAVMRLSTVSALLASIPLAAGAFMGMGGADQSPYCARACRSVLGGANLTCSHMMEMGDHAMMMTAPACRAEDDAWLTSLAYCFDNKCNGKVPLWQLEQLWTETATRSPAVPAKWSYQEARSYVEGEPHMAWMSGHTLNMTMTVPEVMWTNWNNFMPVMDHNSILMFKYS